LDNILNSKNIINYQKMCIQHMLIKYKKNIFNITYKTIFNTKKEINTIKDYKKLKNK